MNVFSVFVLFFYFLFYPITILSTKISSFFIFLIKGQDKETSKEEKVSFGRTDLDNYIKQLKVAENQEFEDEVKFLKRILEFDKIKAKECMVPRNEIIALNISATIEDLIKTMSETGFSKIPIYEDSIDNIKGYVHSISLFLNPKKIQDILVDIPVVPETMSVKDIYKILISNRKSIAVVIDEYGGTSGIITVEDILEEIFGDIQDEHDKYSLEEKVLQDGSFVFSGRLEIDYLNEKYNLNIPQSSDYETLAGYILEKIERFPKKDENLKIDNFNITILEVKEPKILKIKIKPNENK